MGFKFLIFTFITMVAIGCSKKDNNIINNTPNGSNNGTITYGTMTDQDGNTYKTVTIGTQTWMAENLKTMHYANGDPISCVTDNTAWGNLITGAYCSYNNNLSNLITYGCLYNYYAVADVRNICPTGWHIPTNAEWDTLVTYLGGSDIAGGKLKETDTTHWISPNTGATNEKGFTALPGGHRSTAGDFFNLKGLGYWWSSTLLNTTNAYNVSIYYNFTVLGRIANPKKLGFSVRCVKD